MLQGSRTDVLVIMVAAFDVDNGCAGEIWFVHVSTSDLLW